MLIIGAGPAGLYAAYYAGFRGLNVIILDTLPQAGGQISAMYPEKDIFDIAGIPRIKGQQLVHDLLEQANQYSPTYILGEQAVSLTTSDEGPVDVVTDSGTAICAKAVVITGGIGSFTPRTLAVGQEFIGKGIEYFVPRLSDYHGKDVVIFGGGDSAFDWAAALHPIAQSVTLVHRRDSYRAHEKSVELVRSLGVRLITNSEVYAVHGTESVESVSIRNSTDASELELPTTAVIAALGFVANIGPIEGWGLTLEKRRIVVSSSMQTNLPRIFAAGDITTYSGKVPLISVGFGEAGLAVNNAMPFIDEHKGVFPGHSSEESH